MKLIPVVMAVLAVLLAAGCSNSPLVVTRTSPENLSDVTDYDLCRAYFSTSPLAGSKGAVQNELRRRNEDCSRYAGILAAEQGRRAEALKAGTQLLSQPQTRGTNCTSVPNAHGGYDVRCY